MELEEQNTARVVESLVLRGDISALTAKERAQYYVSLCQQLGLNAASNPLALLKLNGKEILYPTRGATDQLAAIHHLNREVIEGPEVRKFGTVELLYCKVRVSHPNGRIETSIATLPGRIDENSLMKLETKAKRRGTLSILGLGMLDETEIESIPAASKATVEQIRPADAYSALDELRDQLASAETTAALRAVYEEHRAAIAEMDVDGVALKQARDACHEHAVAHGWARTKADTDRLLGKGEPLTIDVAGLVVRYASAATTAEVDTIAAQIAGAKLAKEARATLAAAHNEALSRIYCADASAWDARLLASDKAHEVAAAFVKRADAFAAAGVVEARWERTAERLVALGVEDPAAFTDAARARRAA